MFAVAIPSCINALRSRVILLAAAILLLWTAPVSAQDCTSCGGYSVAVTPVAGSVARLTNTSNDTVKFAVQNTGSSPDTYTLTCSKTGGITCTSVTPSTLVTDVGELDSVTVVFAVGASGGTVALNATSTHTSGQGQYTVSCEPSISLVAPVLTSGSRAVVHNRQPIVRATFVPNGSAIDTTKTRLVWRTDTVTALGRTNRGLLEWEADSIHWLAVGDSALATVKICALNGLCATASRWAVLLNDSTPVLGFQGMPLEALSADVGSPLGPGVSVQGADIETAFAIPPYFSRGIARSAGLVYSTRQSYPRALVPVDIEQPWPTGVPTQIKAILFDGALRLDSLVASSPSCASYGGAARRCRAVLQGDFSSSSLGTPTRKWLTVQVQVTSGGITKMSADSVEVVLVDRRTTPYGSGWWISAMPKLVAAGADRLLISPSGTATVYRGNNDSIYLSPPGSFTTLVKVGSTWELRSRGSNAKAIFDVNGRLQAAVDANGNRDTLTYSGSTDKVTEIVDAVGKKITIAYDANGNVSTFTDPGSRQSKVSVNSATFQLTYDSVSSAATKPYTSTFSYQTYSGTGTLVLTRRVGVIADTTSVVYDSTFKRRPVQVTLPRVQDEAGNSVAPTILYTAVQRQGFGGLVSLDSAYVNVTDPRGNWTRSLVNRWGGARRTWDALGVNSRAEFAPEGLRVWAEGKVADSSRVYSAYDGSRRLVKTYIVRSAGDTLRLDSLVYDANDRVIRTIDPQGRTSRLYYDANGNVIASVTPAGDSTSFWYRSDGLLDSTRAPLDTASQRFTYDAIWKNVASVIDNSGETVKNNFYDGLGRGNDTESKIRVQAGVTTYWQWRRIETFYTVANQVDSTRIVRTDNCADPCNDPTWPTLPDTLRSNRVGYRFDRAGRDSLRIDDRGKATMYLYDRLGRVVSRHPWTDSMTVKDSMAYDVAGNLKKTITRRGDTITTNYDTRNRDTLTVVPGVGTLRESFAGPADQLNRRWIDSFVDSIGNVNPEMRWGYDQRGRLKADTAYTGALVRATSYTYDAFERTSSSTDPLGTWTVRYETSRGYLDTLITPYSDTVGYVFDQRSRARGPYIGAAGGPPQDRLPLWTGDGLLAWVAHTVRTPTNWSAGRYDRHILKQGPPLVPTWTEQHGSGAPFVTIEDSLTHDGWERLTSIVTHQDGVVTQRDTFAFDRVGNIRSTSGSESYDVVTNRLVSRSTGAGTRYYTYDRAGNLIRDSLASGAETWVYGYDALNRMRSVRRNGVLVARYGYDVLGQRAVKRVYSSVSGGAVAYTRFVYHGGHVAFETDSAGVIGLRYTWGPGSDNLLAVRDAAGNHFYVSTDPLGNVRGLVKRDGSWVMSQRFGAYGALIGRDSAGSGPGFVLRYAWTGRELDPETGLYFFRSRYYDPNARRFVQEDASGYGGSSNLYAFGDGNPLNGRDPSGMIKSDLFYSIESMNARVGSQMEAMNPSGMSCYVDGVAMSGICGSMAALAGEFGTDPFVAVPLGVSFIPTYNPEPFSIACIGKASCTPDASILNAANTMLYILSLGRNDERKSLDFDYKQELAKFRVSANLQGTPIIWYGTATIELTADSKVWGQPGGYQRLYRVDIEISFPNGWEFSGVGGVTIFGNDGHAFGNVAGNFYPPNFPRILIHLP